MICAPAAPAKCLQAREGRSGDKDSLGGKRKHRQDWGWAGELRENPRALATSAMPFVGHMYKRPPLLRLFVQGRKDFLSMPFGLCDAQAGKGF